MHLIIYWSLSWAVSEKISKRTWCDSSVSVALFHYFLMKIVFVEFCSYCQSSCPSGHTDTVYFCKLVKVVSLNMFPIWTLPEPNMLMWPNISSSEATWLPHRKRSRSLLGKYRSIITKIWLYHLIILLDYYCWWKLLYMQVHCVLQG